MTDPMFRHQRRAIYAAKRLRGQPIVLCRASGITLDAATGVQDNAVTQVSVKRAVILPLSSLRKFIYGRAELTASREFTQGGYFDEAQRGVLVDRRDVPSSFTVDQNMWIVVEGKRMEISKPAIYDEFIAFALIGLTNPISNENNESVSDDLDLTDGVVDS